MILACRRQPGLAQESIERLERRKRVYHAILNDPGSAGDGLPGVVNDSAGIALDGAGDVVLAAHLHGLNDGRSQPRHEGGGWRRRRGTGFDLSRRWRRSNLIEKGSARGAWPKVTWRGDGVVVHRRGFRPP
ncbi:hypothetical protein BHE74_00044210 [Ensete ventricosum]|uniref:Uncharacterized protein n=1 Tax=Ensete ventricosum TaxID=4639 RepID=A0A426XKT7_ENSVE|nr:hypothetical protein B296_00050390 [Ensete ventricosum]RWW49601.1 hypothetical protein BHE74_00044210 [Ensete ventricosum]RZS11636.1 hypothetical protein BHM03_00042993 [Ensete ventricosum]